MAETRTVPAQIQRLLNAWYFFFRLWWIYHYSLGIIGTVSSISVASNPKFMQGVPYLLDGLAWLAAICIALITMLTPSRRAKAYVSAWRLLRDACTRYETDPSFSLQKLLDTAKRGEEQIGQADPT